MTIDIEPLRRQLGRKIEDEDVVEAGAGRGKACLAVECLLDHVAELAQSLGEVLTGATIIFDEQDFHGGPET